MRFQTVRFIGVSLALLAALGFDLSSSDPGPLPYAPGETLTYNLTWKIFPAGVLVATLQKAGEGQGDAYEIRATARSQGFVSLLFNLEDTFQSVFDPNSGCSRQIFKKVNEGRRHRETRIVFDSARKLAVLDEHDPTKPGSPPKHVENETPACVLDLVTAFYYVRRQPLAVGQQIRVPINDGAATHEVSVAVQAREELQTPLGRRLAFRVEPTVFGGLYKRQGRMLIWFSDDVQRLPLRIKAILSGPVGTIVGSLQSVTDSPQKD